MLMLGQTYRMIKSSPHEFYMLDNGDRSLGVNLKAPDVLVGLGLEVRL